jgi:hypothetical protein
MSYEQIGDLPFFRLEHALSGREIGRLWQCLSEGGPRVEELLIVAINKQNASLVATKGAAGLLVKGRKVTTGKGRGGCQSLKRDKCTVELAIDVVGKVLCNLQNAALDIRLLKICHAAKGKECEPKQRQSQR